ncbi:MAG: sulfurtransferase TusA family protein, partial [Magnetococcales bacterium]|nr:sulfurtransferase TusA family protein [Magnetococcales bacterium]
PAAALFLDITGASCPMTYILARLKLAELPPGGMLRIRLSGDEPLENVPRALREDGCQLSEPIPEEGAWLLTAVKPQVAP